MNVDSSQIKSIDYEPKGGLLTIQFHYKDRIHVYAGVPLEAWQQFQHASSKGSYFHKYIKPNFQTQRLH